MKKLLLILLCLPMIGFGQNVYIPDANFKAYLVGEPSINTNGDTEIQLTEANLFNDTIECYGMNISDLTGIEAFTDLTYLACDLNQLTNLDVSQNTALTYFSCGYNQLTSLDVSQNTILEVLECWNNQLTSLDISQNTILTSLTCHNNQLTSLDVSQNTVLTWLLCMNNQLITLNLNNNSALNFLACDSNQLTSIDLSQNTVLIEFSCQNNQLTTLDISNNTALFWFTPKYNPSLTCIQVDDVAWSTANWTNIDPQHYFSNNCSGTAIEEHITNKELLKVTDVLGREAKQMNQPLFYIYDDGTVEKRIVIE